MSADVNGLTPLSPNMPVPTCVGPSPHTLHGRVAKIASALTAIQPDSASRMPCLSSSIVALSSGERTNGARSARMVVSLYSVQVELAAGQTSCPMSKVSRTPAKGKSPVKTKLDTKAKSHGKVKPHVKARKRHAR
jgi:hypothetical protein